MSKKLLKRKLSLLLTVITVLAFSFGTLTVSAASTTINNDTFFKDTSGNPIYSQGGGIFKFGSTYYWYGVRYTEAATYYNNPTKKIGTCTFAGFSCYSSTDMVNWKYEKDIMTSSTPGLEGATWVGRMGVAYNSTSKKYVLLSQFSGTNGSGELFATCDTPNGNFTYNHIQTDFPMFVNNGTGDQTIFQDDDGKAYLICSSASGRSHLYVAPLRAADFLSIDTATQVYSGNGREGNCMFKYNGRYYFCSSDLHGWNASHCYVISSSSILGTYSAETVMAGTDSSFCHASQTGFFVTVAGTSGSTVIFCGDRWADFAGNGIGYNQWCPLSFNGTTPTFNDLSQWNFNAAASTWTVGAANNYVHNGDFEADRVVTSTLTGWTNTGSGANLAGKQYSGNFVLQHYSTSAFTAFTNQINTVPNGTYTLKAWVKSSGGQSTCRLFARNFGGTEIQYNINNAISTWTQVTLSSAINVTNGSIDVGLYSVGAAGNWAQVDNITLTKN
jgi:hypothetical protein